MLKRILRGLAKGLGVLVFLLLFIVGVLYLVLRHGRPAGGVGGAEADALAHAIEKTVNLDGWNRTAAVRFTWSGKHRHLWDRWRNLDRVRWNDNEVLVDIQHQSGVAFHAGRRVTGEAEHKLVESAYRYWINDTFWLNPLVKLMDPGTSRLRLEEGGHPALLLSYASGGVTPGDSYLWILGDDGRPKAWRMWVSVIPVPGIEASWEGWTTLSTGAMVATDHRTLGRSLVTISDLAAADSLPALEPGPDPFAALIEAGPGARP